MLSAYFDIKPSLAVKKAPPRKAAKTSKVVEAFDEQPSHAAFKPDVTSDATLGVTLDATSDEDIPRDDEVGEVDEYEYLMAQALEAPDPDEDTDIATDFEDESPSIDAHSSLSSSPDTRLDRPDVLFKRAASTARRPPGASETPVYVGPELWQDDDYSDMSDDSD